MHDLKDEPSFDEKWKHLRRIVVGLHYNNMNKFDNFKVDKVSFEDVNNLLMNSKGNTEKNLMDFKKNSEQNLMDLKRKPKPNLTDCKWELIN